MDGFSIYAAYSKRELSGSLSISFYVRPIVLDPPFDVLKEFEFPTRLNEYSEERRNGVTIIVGLIDGFTLICGSGAAARFCCIWLGPWRFVV